MKLWHAFLCKIGFHDWHLPDEYDDARVCKRCGKEEWGEGE